MRRLLTLTLLAALALAASARAERPAASVVVQDDKVAVHGAPADAPFADEVRGIVRGLLDRLGADTGLPAPRDDGDGRADVWLLKSGATKIGLDPDNGPEGRSAWLELAPEDWQDPDRARAKAIEFVVVASQAGIDYDEAGGPWWPAAQEWAITALGGTPTLTECPLLNCTLRTTLAPALPGLVPAVWERLRTLGAGVNGSFAEPALRAELEARGEDPDAALSSRFTARAFADGSWAAADCLLSLPEGGSPGALSPVTPWEARRLVLRIAACGAPPPGTKLRLYARGDLAPGARAVLYRGGETQVLALTPVAAGGLRPGETAGDVRLDVPLDPPPDAVAVGIANLSAGDRYGGLGYLYELPEPVVAAAPPPRPRAKPRAVLERASCRLLKGRDQRCVLHGYATPSTVKAVQVGLVRKAGRRCIAPLGARGVKPGPCPKGRAPAASARFTKGTDWALAVRLPRGRVSWRLELRAVDSAGTVTVTTSTARLGYAGRR